MLCWTFLSFPMLFNGLYGFLAQAHENFWEILRPDPAALAVLHSWRQCRGGEAGNIAKLGWIEVNNVTFSVWREVYTDLCKLTFSRKTGRTLFVQLEIDDEISCPFSRTLRILSATISWFITCRTGGLSVEFQSRLVVTGISNVVEHFEHDASPSFNYTSSTT